MYLIGLGNSNIRLKSIQTLFDIFFICQKSKTWYASSILVQVIAIVILKIEIDKRR